MDDDDDLDLNALTASPSAAFDEDEGSCGTPLPAFVTSMMCREMRATPSLRLMGVGEVVGFSVWTGLQNDRY